MIPVRNGPLQRVAVRVRGLVDAALEATPPEVQAPMLRVFGAEPNEPAEPTTPRLVASYDGK